MTKITLTFILFFVVIFNSNAQTTDLKEVFLAAESYFLFEEFDEALPLYLRVHRHFPDNDNVNYKIGVCYLNNPYEKSKSVFYLEKAVQNINLKYKENNFRETSAPLEALFYLANAYRITSQFDKARDYYNTFLEQLDPKLFDGEMVREQLKVLDAAENLIKRPVDLDYIILSDKINSRFSDIRAVISGNENHMVYVSRLQFYDAVFYTEKINGQWSDPRNIITELGVDGDVYPTCLSWDGTELYIYRSDDFIGNIYVSNLEQGKWGPMVKLNTNINTKYWESHASINKNGNKLYFTSNRTGGYGGLDIYVSTRSETVDWQPAVNLGPVINTKYNEETPFIADDDRKLFFSSYGHYNMGGYDVFVSILNENGTWAEPRNLGYPVNTLDDDLFYQPYRNGQFALFSRFKEDGFGRHDIYNYQVYTHEFPRMYLITGYLDLPEKTDTSDVHISVLDVKTKDTLTIINPDMDGAFSFKVPAGTYDMIFNSSKFHEYMQRLEVSQKTPHSGMIIPGKISLVPLTPVLTPEELDRLITLRDTLVTVDSDKTTKLRFNAERGATVIIDVYNDSALISSDTIDSARRRDVFEFNPQPGSNIVEFTVVDKDGNTISRQAEVIFEKSTPDEKKKQPETSPKKEIQITSITEKDETVDSYKSILQNNAEGNLKTFLENVDPDNEGIKTKEELISFLRKQANNNQYTLDDVNRMIEKSSGTNDLDIFLQNLSRVSRGNLKNTLSGFIPAERNVSTPYELTTHLLDNSLIYGYNNPDVISSLGILASGESDDIAGFLAKLTEKSDGKLKQYLSSVSPSAPDIQSPAEMAVHIYNQAEKQGFDNKDFAKILTEMAVRNALESFRDELADLAQGELKKVLNQINFDEQGINSSNDLIKYLYDNAGVFNYTSKDVDNLLSEMALKNLREIENLQDQLEMVATGQLLEFLKEINLNNYTFNSEEEFLNYLYANAQTSGYTKDQLNNALLKLAYDDDLIDIIAKLAKLADGNLRKTLLNLNPEKENIKDFGDLVQYLIDNSRKYGYTENDVYDLFKKYFSYADAELFLKKLIRLSEGDIKDYLKKIDLFELEISNRQELINYLLTDADKGIINKENIIRLILKAAEISAAQIIPDLKLISSPDVLKLIESAEKNKSLKNADQVFDYLLNAVLSNTDISQQVILDLFSDYLKNYEIKQLINKMAGKAEGGLKNALLKLDISKEGVKNTGDLINYLLSKTDEFGYTSKDVFNLIQSVFGKENLRDFIQQLIPFTHGNLKSFLQNLDLNESTDITNIEELIKYILGMAGKFNFEESDIWDAITNMILSKDEIHAKSQLVDKYKPGKVFLRNIAVTGGIFAMLGLIIFLFIWYEKKKKRKNE